MQPLEKNQTGILDQNDDAAELTAIILVRSIEEKIDGLEINPGDTGKGGGRTNYWRWAIPTLQRSRYQFTHAYWRGQQTRTLFSTVTLRQSRQDSYSDAAADGRPNDLTQPAVVS